MVEIVSRNYAKEHKEILKELYKETDKGECACVSVNAFAKKLGKDVRTVRAHLEIASHYKTGAFLDKSSNIFCTKDGIKKVHDILEDKSEKKLKRDY